MSAAALGAALEAAAVATLEQLAFGFAYAEPAASPEPADAAAEVAFEGPCRGVLRLRLGGGVLPALAANMLGQDEGPAEALQLDALAEIANVVCGNVLPHVGGTRAVFRLGSPRTAAGEPAPRGEPAARARLAVEDGWAEVALWLEGRGQGLGVGGQGNGNPTPELSGSSPDPRPPTPDPCP